MGISFNDVIPVPLLEALPKQDYILKHRLVFLVIWLLFLDLPSASDQTLPLVLVFFHYAFDLAQTCSLACILLVTHRHTSLLSLDRSASSFHLRERGE